MHKYITSFLSIILFAINIEGAGLETGMIVPDKFYPGQETEIIITRPSEIDGQLFPEDIQADLGEGITISSITSANPYIFNSIKATVVVTTSASLGFRDITLTSLQDDETEVVTNAIEVVDKSSFPISFNTKSINVFNLVREPSSLAVSDFDKDGDIDIAVGGSGNIALFKNSGAGEFSQYKILKTKIGKNPRAIVFGDFNGDKRIDIAAITPNHPDEKGGFLSVCYGKKKGRIRKKAKIFKTGTEPTSLGVGDFNDDNVSDLVVAVNGTTLSNKAKGNISFYFGKVNKKQFDVKKIKAGKRPNSIIVDDVNEDEKPDVIYIADKGNAIYILLAKGGKRFKIKKNSNLNLGCCGVSMSIFDYDNDGNLDILAPYFNKATNLTDLIILNGNGRGKFNFFKKTDGLGFRIIDDFNNDG
ncbi:MAG: VCBS repeat-containing protein, partial [Calditrichaeota bacterium]